MSSEFLRLAAILFALAVSVPAAFAQAPQGAQSTSEPVFVNGRLVGMTQETETVPAKFSEKNAADDKLIIIAYTFKALPDDQRQAIYEGLKGEPPVENVGAEIGTELPAAIELRALPAQIVRQVPQTQGYQFAVSDHRVLLVAPANRIVVAVFSSPSDVTTGAGERVR